VFSAMPQPLELGKMSLMAVLQWGSRELLKQASMAEITEYQGVGEVFLGERNGFRETTIDTPIRQVTYDHQRMANATRFQSQLHVPYMRRPEEFANAIAEMYVQGVSTRKLKRTLHAMTGEVE